MYTQTCISDTSMKSWLLSENLDGIQHNYTDPDCEHEVLHSVCVAGVPLITLAGRKGRFNLSSPQSPLNEWKLLKSDTKAR